MPQRERRLVGWHWLTGPLASVGLALLVFLCSLALRDPTVDVASAPSPPPDWAADFPARITAVTEALGRLAWPLPAPREEPQGAGALRWIHRRYELTLPAPEDPAAIGRMLEPVRVAAPGVTLRIRDDAVGARVQVGIDGLLTHTLNLHWLGRRARVAIIIDDLGSDLLIARSLAEIRSDLTFAVVPRRPFSREVAELAALFGREVLLQLPAEREAAAGVHSVSDDRDHVIQDLDQSLTMMPRTRGVSDCVGSRLTSDRVHLLWVLEDLRQRGLFFVDTRATPGSVACDVAAAIALPCVSHTVRLDQVDDVAAVRKQIEALPALAREHGVVIAVARARAATVAALQAGLPPLAAAGIEIVPVSAIVPAPRASEPPEPALSAR